MKRETIVALLLTGLMIPHVSGCRSEDQRRAKPQGTAHAFDSSKSEAKAIQLAEAVATAAGGRKKFNAIGYLSFRFVVVADTNRLAEWQHHWDRRTNRYRVEGVMRDGRHLLAFFNLDTQEGKAFIDSEPAAGDETRRLLGLAYSRYINDTYWLLFPFKLSDPGARLQYEGTRRIDDSEFEVLRLSFVEPVGLTPDNVYRAFIDTRTNLIGRWEYQATSEAEPVGARWEGWQDFGGIRLATRRVIERSERKILFENIVVSSEVDEAVFQMPEKATASFH